MSDAITKAVEVVWSEEKAYDEKIQPLMAKILAICKEHRIPFLASFNIGYEGPADGPFMCTSFISFEDRQVNTLNDCLAKIYANRTIPNASRRD